MIKGMSARDKNALIILITIVLAALSYMYLIEPTWIKYNDNLSIINIKGAQLDIIKNNEKDSSNLDGKIYKYTQKLQNLSLELPNKINSAELLYMLQTEAEKVNVDLIKLEETSNTINSITKPEKTEFVPYKITVKGKAAEVYKLIELVEKLQRKVIISDVKIEMNDQDKKFYAEITIAPFYLNESSIVQYDSKKLIP